MDDKHTENQEFVLEPIKQSSQSLQDPIVDVLDDLCCQIHISFSNYELKRSYDQDMIRQSVAWPSLGKVSLQNSYQNMQSNQNLHDDTNIINTVINHDLELDEFD